MMKKIIIKLFILLIAIGVFTPVANVSADEKNTLVLKNITLKANVNKKFTDDIYVILQYEDKSTGIFVLQKKFNYERNIEVKSGELKLFKYQITRESDPNTDTTNNYYLEGKYKNNIFQVTVKDKDEKKEKVIKKEKKKSLLNRDSVLRYGYIPISIIVVCFIGILIISVRLYINNKKIK